MLRHITIAALILLTLFPSAGFAKSKRARTPITILVLDESGAVVPWGFVIGAAGKEGGS